MCDGSDGKAEDLGPTGPVFKPWPRQENIFSSFGLDALEPLGSNSK